MNKYKILAIGLISISLLSGCGEQEENTTIP